MATLYDLGQKVMKVREAINEMDVRGSRNASYVVYAVKTCNEIIQMINGTAEESAKKEEANDDEQQHSDTTE